MKIYENQWKSIKINKNASETPSLDSERSAAEAAVCKYNVFLGVVCLCYFLMALLMGVTCVCFLFSRFGFK